MEEVITRHLIYNTPAKHYFPDKVLVTSYDNSHKPSTKSTIYWDCPKRLAFKLKLMGPISNHFQYSYRALDVKHMNDVIVPQTEFEESDTSK